MPICMVQMYNFPSYSNFSPHLIITPTFTFLFYLKCSKRAPTFGSTHLLFPLLRKPFPMCSHNSFGLCVNAASLKSFWLSSIKGKKHYHYFFCHTLLHFFFMSITTIGLISCIRYLDSFVEGSPILFDMWGPSAARTISFWIEVNLLVELSVKWFGLQLSQVHNLCCKLTSVLYSLTQDSWNKANNGLGHKHNIFEYKISI